MAGHTPPKLLGGVRHALTVGSLSDKELTAFRVALEERPELRIPLIEPLDLDEGEAATLSSFWKLRSLAGLHGDELIPLSEMLTWISLSEAQRAELDLMRALDREYLDTLANMKPERRQNLSKRRTSHLKMVKDADREE